MQQIFVRGNAGLCHMLTTTNGALNLSEFLNAQGIGCEIYHDWIGWQCWYDIFEVQHKCFDRNKKLTPKDNVEIRDIKNISLIQEAIAKNLPMRVTQYVQCGLNNPEDFFHIYKLTQKTLQHLQKSYDELDKGEYIAIHCRGGDMIRLKYQEGFDMFFKTQILRIDNILKNQHSNIKVLLVSDNQEILQHYVDNKRVFSTSIALKLLNQNVVIPQLQALHSTDKSYTKNLATEFDMCLSSVQDLFLMAHSKSLYSDHTNSSFSQTGLFLHRQLQKHPNLCVLH